ncbi:MAG: hypothetical protein QS721_03515 [Candidatus Endonucleobacter sp. (ex Gigantidas childressi)]|nr:hypothetical protein [Candidatus Endonucleobacter sp. (ex Gigantidas childressi)]
MIYTRRLSICYVVGFAYLPPSSNLKSFGYKTLQVTLSERHFLLIIP